MRTICAKCGGQDIRQQASIMVEINKEIIKPEMDNFVWDDYYYCMDCADECQIDVRLESELESKLEDKKL